MRLGESKTSTHRGEHPAQTQCVDVLPPSSPTGAEITVHWLRGGFDKPEKDVLDTVSRVLGTPIAEHFDWGRMMYRRHAVFAGGLVGYFDPVAENMPAVMLDASGEVCEGLGLDKLRVLFEDSELSRADIAFDHAPFSPADLAAWDEAGNIRTRAKASDYKRGIRGDSGNKYTLGSRSSEQYLRAYDSRGFTRVELELKGKAARGFKAVLMASDEAFVQGCVGALRSFVDFVDVSSSCNSTRRTLLPSWESFTQGLEKVFLRVGGAVEQSAEKVEKYIREQVAASLYTYVQLGNSISELLELGRFRVKDRHRAVLASVGLVGT